MSHTCNSRCVDLVHAHLMYSSILVPCDMDNFIAMYQERHRLDWGCCCEVVNMVPAREAPVEDIYHNFPAGTPVSAWIAYFRFENEEKDSENS